MIANATTINHTPSFHLYSFGVSAMVFCCLFSVFYTLCWLTFHFAEKTLLLLIPWNQSINHCFALHTVLLYRLWSNM